MSEERVFASRVATPNEATGAVGVNRPCVLRGWWVLPGTTGGPFNIQLSDSATSKTGTTLVQFDVGLAGSNTGTAQSWFPIPGGGIRFDNGIWVQGEDTNTIASITLFYS